MQIDRSSEMIETPFESAADGDRLAAYAGALRDYFPSKEDILREAKQQTARKRTIKKMTASISAIAVAVLTWMLDPVIQQQEMATAIGQQATHALPDGSKITLNTQSQVQIEYRLHSRNVRLTTGEALFHVAHGWRSFTVQANNTHIRDIGTVFNVRNTQHGAIVTVLEGAVEVRLSHQEKYSAPQILRQNQAVETDAHTMHAPNTVDTNTVAAWSQGKLFFDGTPLSQAVSEMQRYRQAPIVLKDKRIAKLRISGAYDIQGIESLLDTLPLSVAVNVTHQKDGSVEIRAR